MQPVKEISEATMQPAKEISEVRLCGFYKLKKLLGIGDDKLEMILAVSGLKPIDFSNEKTGDKESQYPLFIVKKALEELTGRDVAAEYRRIKELEAMPEQVREKYEEINFRLMNRKKRLADQKL